MLFELSRLGRAIRESIRTGLFCSWLLLAGLTVSSAAVSLSRASANTINLVTPSGLHAGDTFRFVFVTSSHTTGESNDVAYYNQVVENEASVFNQTYYDGRLVTGWKSIVSVWGGINARTNVGPWGGGVYLPTGAQVAVDATRFWGANDTPLLHAINATIDGSALAALPVPGPPGTYTPYPVWTGSYWDGTSGVDTMWIDGIFPIPTSASLGKDTYYGVGSGPVVGDLYAVGGAFLFDGYFSRSSSLGLYGMSPVLTVPDSTSVPEIDIATGSSALSLVAGVLAMIEQRRRRATLVA
jgi:hypothetical protein